MSILILLDLNITCLFLNSDSTFELADTQ